MVLITWNFPWQRCVCISPSLNLRNFSLVLWYKSGISQKTQETLEFLEIIYLGLNNTVLHTYLISHYNLSFRIIDLVSHTTYVVCVNFIHKWRDLQFNSRLETTDFLRNFFMAWFICSQSFYQKSAERKWPKKYFFVFCFDDWPGCRTLALRLISQHTTTATTLS